jgi:putative PIN family toxin of toxin-antitoxin system
VVVVVDTNVFVSACFGTGASSQVIASCLTGRHVPLMGAALLAEHEDVLARASVFSKCRLSARERNELFDIYIATCRWTRIYFGWRPNLRDERDNHVIELAVAGGATYVISRNVRDFHSAQLRFPDITITTPAHFLREVAT